MHCFPFLFPFGLDRLFFHLEGTIKVVTDHIRQMVVLYSNDCMRICLGGLSTGCLIEVVVWAGLTIITINFLLANAPLLKTSVFIFF